VCSPPLPPSDFSPMRNRGGGGEWGPGPEVGSPICWGAVQQMTERKGLPELLTHAPPPLNVVAPPPNRWPLRVLAGTSLLGKQLLLGLFALSCPNLAPLKMDPGFVWLNLARANDMGGGRAEVTPGANFSAR